jgi:hypothetical protein
VQCLLFAKRQCGWLPLLLPRTLARVYVFVKRCTFGGAAATVLLQRCVLPYRSPSATEAIVAAAPCPAFLCRSFADPGVLNCTEWVKFVAVFFNKEVEAEPLLQCYMLTYYNALVAALCILLLQVIC